MSLDQGTVTTVVNALEAAYGEGVQDGEASAQAIYFGKSVRVLTGGIFAAALSQTGSMLRQHDAEAAQFFADKAAEFVAWITPPTVQTTDPANNATGIVTSSAVNVKFVTPGLDASSVTTDTVYVTPASGGSHLAGTVSYDEDTCTASFTPTNGFSPDTQYKLTLDANLAAAGGMLLGTPITFVFTTGDS